MGNRDVKVITQIQFSPLISDNSDSERHLEASADFPSLIIFRCIISSQKYPILNKMDGNIFGYGNASTIKGVSSFAAKNKVIIYILLEQWNQFTKLSQFRVGNAKTYSEHFKMSLYLTDME